MDDGSVFSHCLINSNTDLQVLLFCVELTYDNYNKSTSYPAIQQLVFAADRYRLTVQGTAALICVSRQQDLTSEVIVLVLASYLGSKH